MTRTSFGLFTSAAFVAIGAAGVVAFSSTSPSFQVSYMRVLDATEMSTTTAVEIPSVVHMQTPVPVKAIYMTQCAVGTPSFRDDLTKLIDETELNAIVIDIKDYSGG